MRTQYQALLKALFLSTALMATLRTHAATVPYSTDFETGIGSEWSDTTLDATYPQTFTKFSGRYSNQSQTLSLSGLTAGVSYTIGFDLYVIDSWDGNGDGNAVVIEADGNQLFNYTFSNYNGDPPNQPQSYPSGPDVGRFDMGFAGYVDAIYRRIEVSFIAGGTSTAITFRGQNVQDISDESWGIDNVSVKKTSDLGGTTIYLTTLPNEGTTSGEAIESFTITGDRALDATAAGTSSNYSLREAGANQVLGDADDKILTLTPTVVRSKTVSFSIAESPLQPGKYRFESKNLKDGNGNAVADFTRNFNVAHPVLGKIEGLSDDTLELATTLPLTESPAGSRYYTGLGVGTFSSTSDVDFWRFDAEAGDVLNIRVEGHGQSIYPQLQLQNASGGAIWYLSGNYQGDLLGQGFTISTPGTYYIRVWSNNNKANYKMRVELSRGVQLESENNSATGNANPLALTIGTGSYTAKVGGALDYDDPEGDYYRVGILNVGNAVGLSLGLPTGSTLSGNVNLSLFQDGVSDPVATADGTSLNFTAQGDGFYYIRVKSSAPQLRAQYVLSMSIADGVPPLVNAITLPAEGADSTGVIDRFTITFSEELQASTVTDPANYDLRAAGADGNFGTADDVIYTVANQAYQNGLTAFYLITDGPLQPGSYRLTVQKGITDRGGNHLVQAFVRNFTFSSIAGFVVESRSNDTLQTATEVTPADPDQSGVRRAAGRGNLSSGGDSDYFSFAGKAGDQVMIASETPDHSGASGLLWYLFKADGNQLTYFYGNYYGTGQSAPVNLPADGTYYVRPNFNYGWTGEYRFRVSIVSPPLSIETESNDSQQQANVVPDSLSGKTQSGEVLGYISDADTSGDFYRIGSLAFGAKIDLALTHPADSLFVGVMEIWKDGASIASSNAGDASLSYTLPADGAGNYYLHVTDSAGGGLFNEYLAKISITDSTAPSIISVNLPDENSTSTLVNPNIQLTFSEDMMPSSVNDLTNYELRSAGADGTFGNGDDQLYNLVSPNYVNGTTATLFVSDNPLQPGKYQFTIKNSLKDGSGNALASAFVRHFTVVGVPGFILENRGNDGYLTATSLSLNPGGGDGSFIPAVQAGGTGAQPWGIVTGDFNGDGNLDVASANISGANITVMLGDGKGAFGTPVNYQSGSGPISITSADFNGDTIPDLAVANYYGNTIGIFIGKGDGTFNDAVTFPGGGNPRYILTADLNHDSKADLAFCNENGRTISIRLGNGDGTFQDAVDYSINGNNPYQIAIADLNGDGALDLVSANTGSDTISVLLGTGNGTFGSSSQVTVGSNPRSVAAIDLNGDGTLDLAVVRAGSNPVAILLGKGDGTFNDALNIDASTAEPYNIQAADLNGDGKGDLAIANHGRSAVTVLLGKGDGTFSSTYNYGLNGSAIGIAFGDFDKDGRLDIAAAGYNGNIVSILFGARNQPLTEDPAGSGIRTGVGRGFLALQSDSDLWSFSGRAGDHLVVASETPDSLPSSGLFYDILGPDGNRLNQPGVNGYFYPDYRGFGQSPTLTLPTDGTYYVRVSRWYDYFGEYRLRVTLAPGSVQFESEQNDSLGQANAVDFGLAGGPQSATLMGYLNVIDRPGDFYNLGNLAAGTTITLNEQQPSSSTISGRLTIFNAQGTAVMQGNPGAAALNYTLPQGGDGSYYVRVDSAGPARPGDAGPFLSFDGNNQYVDTGHWAPANTYSVEAWVRVSALPGGRRGVAGAFSACQDWGLSLWNNELSLIIRPPGGCSDGVSSKIVPQVDRWYHMAGTVDGTTAKIYINGELKASGPVSSDYAPTADGMRIGGEVCCGNYFPGLIDDVRVWNRALSQDEIVANYKKQLIGNESGLIGYWKFDEGTGTTVADASGNGHDGTLVNGLGWVTTGGESAGGLGLLSQYVLDVELGDTNPPRITAVSLPDEGSSSEYVPASFTVSFSEDMDRNTVNNAANYELRGAGKDGALDTADDELYAVAPAAYSSGLTASYSIADGPLQTGLYRFTIKTGLKDRSGSALESASVRNFRVIALSGGFVRETRGNNDYATPTPITLIEQIPGSGIVSGFGLGNLDDGNDVDVWAFEGTAGDRLEVATETPGDQGASQLFFDIRKPDQQRLDYFWPDYYGRGQTPRDRNNPLILPATGTYYVVVSRNYNYFGLYRLRITVAHPPAELENENNDPNQLPSPINLTAENGHLMGVVGGYINASDAQASDNFALGNIGGGATLNAAWVKPASSDVSLKLEILSPAGASLAASATGQNSVSYSVPVNGAGIYYLRATPVSGTPGILAQYLVNFDFTDSTAPQIVSDSLPAQGSSSSALIDRFSINFSEDMDAGSLGAVASYDLRGPGADGNYGTGDDIVYAIQPQTYTTGLSAAYRIANGPLPSGNYRFQVLTSVRDRIGNPLGGIYERNFSISGQTGRTSEREANDSADSATPLNLVESPAKVHSAIARGVISSSSDVDYWSFNGTSGQVLLMSTEAPAHLSGSSIRYTLKKPDGSSLTAFTSDGNGYAETQPITLDATGKYLVIVQQSQPYEGEYDFVVSLADSGLGVEREYNDGPNGNSVITLVTTGDNRAGSGQGIIYHSGDLDYYSLGALTSGSTVFLATRVRDGSTFSPNVAVYTSANAYMTEAGSGRAGDGVAEVRIVQDGTYYAVVRSGDATGGAGGLYVLDVQVVPTGSVSFPNVQVVSVTPPTGALQSGQAANIGFVVRNVGSVATPSALWSDRVVMSANNIIGDGDDYELGVFAHSGALDAGADYAVNQSVILPNGVAGTFYLIVQTDFANEINEFVLEGDNTTVSSGTFTVNPAPYPDLRVEDLAVAGPDANNNFAITWKTANRGNSPVNTAFKERLFVKNTTSGNVLANTERDVTAVVAAGATISQSASVTTTEAGVYQVIVTTDSTDKIYEYTSTGHADAEQNSAQAGFSILAKYSVTLAKNPADGGTVTGGGTFSDGTSVTVTATPNTTQLPYQFLNWTENGVAQSTTAQYTFKISNNRQLVANFGLPSFQVTAGNNPAGGGTVSGAGSYSYGSSATLVASPNFGYNFKNWTEAGAIIGTDPSLTLTVTKARTVVANWNDANLTHNVTVATLPAEVGGAAGGGTFNNGQSSTISAPASITKNETVYTFKRFTLNGAAYGTSASFTKTFATTDAVDMAFVAEYDSRSQFPLVTSVGANYNNPVPQTSNLQLTVHFNRSMKTSVEPIVKLINSAPGATQPVVPTGGTWSTTTVVNDTYRTKAITIAAGMDGSNQMNVSGAQDTDGATMKPANVYEVVVDATFPKISNIAVSRGSGSVVVTWDTDEASSSQVEYGTTTSYGKKTPLSVALVTSHRVVVSALAPQTTYHFRVAARDKAGNEAVSADGNFTTLPAPDLQVTGVGVSPGVLTSGSSIIVNWTLQNKGAGPTSGSWFDQVTILNQTRNKVLAQDYVYYDATRFGDIASQGSKAALYNFTLPEGPDGAGTIVVTITSDFYNNVIELPAPAAENNNTGTTTVSSTLRNYPDLQVQTLAISPAGLQSGNTATISWQDANTGAAAAGGLITDSVVVRNTTTGEWLLNTSVAYDTSAQGNSPIGAGQSLARQVSFTLPDGTRGAGQLAVEVTTDIGNSVFEYNAGGTGESNNQTAINANSTVAAYPDLTVISISAPASGVAGQTIAVSWVVKNNGTKATAGAWTDQVFLSNDPAVGGDQFIGSFNYSDSVAAGASVTRTETLTLPQFGTGNRWIVIVTDAGNSIFESNEQNNVSIDDQAINLPSNLSLSFSSTTFSEGAGSGSVFGTVVRNSGTANSLQVLLSSSAETAAKVPASVTIPAGQTSVSFPVTAIDDALVDGSQTTTITASAAGFDPVTATLTVEDNDSPKLTVSIAPQSVSEGAGSSATTGTVSRNTPTTQALQIALTSSHAKVVLPPTVTIAAGSASATFPVAVLDNDTIDGTQNVTITANTAGFASGIAVLEVTDNDSADLQVTLERATVSEGDANPATLGTVSRLPISNSPVTVTLNSSDTTAANVPSQVVIPAGAGSVRFPINVVDDSIVDGPQTAVIYAYVTLASGQVVPDGAASATLTVTDNDGPTLSLVSDAAIIAETGSTFGTVTRNTATTQSLVVSLLSSNPNEATVPANVTILAGSTSARFEILGMSDNVSDGIKKVVITAKATGFTDGSETISVSDVDLPDLRVTKIVMTPTTGVTQSSFRVSWTVQNNGIAPAIGSWLDRVYLSTDDQLGGDTLLTSVAFNGTVGIGETYTQSRLFNFPVDTGHFRIIVVTDADDTLLEGAEANNTTVSTESLEVIPAYRATVSTDVTVVGNGTPIPLHGRAFDSANAPVGGKAVTVRVLVNGTRRVIRVITDTAGEFSTVFQPLPNEAGEYIVGADHPGVAEDPNQDQFTILGMAANPAQLDIQVVPNIPVSGNIELKNLSPIALTGLKGEIQGAPSILQVQLTPPARLDGNGTGTLGYSINATDASLSRGRILLHITTAEGGVVDIPVGITITPLRPQLLATPGSLSRGMVRGSQSILSFDVANTGGAPSGNLSVLLPDAPWLSLNSDANLGSLQPGEKRTITLALKPALDLPLQKYDGVIVIQSSETSLNVPFSFRAISDATGNVKVAVNDDYTFHVAGAPKVSGAAVRLRDPFDNSIIAAEGTTDDTGVVTLPSVREGVYLLEVQADKHQTYHGSYTILPGVTGETEVFIARETITYSWNVVPTEIEDHYKITLESTFEVDVPVPVVTVEAPSKLPELAPGESTQIDVTFTNHGLIAAQDLKMTLPTHPEFTFVALSDSLGVLPAKSSISVPVTVTRLGGLQPQAGGGGCIVWLGGLYFYECGKDKVYHPVYTGIDVGLNTCYAQALFDTLAYFLGGFGGFGGGTGGGSGPGGGTPTLVSTAPSVSSPSTCDPCANKRLIAIAKCVEKFIPFPDWFKCLKDSYKCVSSGINNGVTAGTGYKCFKVVVSCSKAAGKSIPYTKYLKVLECGYELISACADSGGAHSANVRTMILHSNAAAGGDLMDTVKLRVARLQKNADALTETYGDPAWLQVEDTVALDAWLNAFLSAIDEASDGGEKISATERTQLLALSFPAPLTTDVIKKFLDRWNRTVDYWAAGIFNVSQVPAGQSTDFLAVDRWATLLDAASDAIDLSEAEGFVDLVDGVQQAVDDVKASLETGKAGVCARVKIRIEQEAVLTRAAFLGTLEIDNGNATKELTGVRVNLDIRAEDGTPANDRFGIKGPVLKGLSAVDGNGVIAANGSGSAQFTFIPNRTAAPEGPQVYHFGGTLRYIDPDTQQEVVVPLFPSTLTVYPDPFLELTYFQQRDVYSDDPFTDEIEPAEPFVLGLRVKNSGKGLAKNFRITSAQPKIIENEKGLLIDFKIIGTQVGNQTVTPSLTANLGNIDPGKSQVAKWLLVSTLQGKFIDYSATFEHIDGLGDPRLSLIDKVEIKELIHAVQADRQGDDDLPDFLVNDIPDPNDLPDTVYLSDGSVAPVNVIPGAAADAPATTDNPSAVVRANMTSGWNYFTVADPGAGFRLYRAVRSDGKVMRVSDNVWQTDRSFPNSEAGARREHLIHIFDYNGTGSYTLYYRVDDSVAPSIDHIVAVDPVVQSGPVGTIDVVFSEDIDLTSFTFDDVTLTHNGGANLINNGVTIEKVADKTYRIGGLSGLTGDVGNYELTVSGTGIQDFGGNSAAGTAVVQWAVAGTAPVLATIQQVVPALRNIPVSSLDVTFSKAIDLTKFDFNDLSLTKDGGPNLISSGVTITLTGGSTYRVSGLGSLTADSGGYIFSVDATGVQDALGNQGVGALSVRWTMDTAGPTISSLEQVTTNPRNIVVPGLTVTFSEPIDPATFDWTDITLSRNGGPSLITSAVKVTQIDPATYRVDNFTWVSGIEGQYVLTVNAAAVRDAAGNAGQGSASASWLMDTTRPVIPTQLAISPDLGASSTDGITSVQNVTLSGPLLEPNLTIHVFDVTANADMGSATVTANSLSKPLQLAEGLHRFRLQAIDLAGNFSEEVFYDVVIDLASPTAIIQAVVPDPRDSAVDTLDVTFSETINEATFIRTDLTLTRNGGANLINNSVSIQFVGNHVYRISGLGALTTDGGLYEFGINMGAVQDIAGNKGGDKLTRSWRRIGPNTAPVIDPIQDKIVSADTLLTFTVSATDSDIPENKLTFSLEPGAPVGAAINSGTGVFRWTPSRAQAPGVYSITVTVKDDGTPIMSASKTFKVTVTDFAEINVGQDIVLAGQQGAVPIEFFASAPATEIAFDINVPAGFISALTADPLVPEIASATIQKVSDTQYHVQISARSGSVLQTREEILEIGYTAAANTHSAFVRVAPASLAVQKSDGTPITALFARAGRVILIAAEPLAEAILNPGEPRHLMLYGRIGVNYQIQRTPDLKPASVWTEETRVTMADLLLRIDLAPATGRAIFYRARQLP